MGATPERGRESVRSARPTQTTTVATETTMIHETLTYTVPSSAVPACRQAIRELVERVREEEPHTALYTVLEDVRNDEATFLHLAAFENHEARIRHRESEALRMFTDLVYPATADGMHMSEQKVVDRLPDRAVRVRP